MRKRKVRKEMIQKEKEIARISDINNWLVEPLFGQPNDVIYTFSYHISSPMDDALSWMQGRYDIIGLTGVRGMKYDVRYITITHFAETHVIMGELVDVLGTDLETLDEAVSAAANHYRERLENERSIYEHS